MINIINPGDKVICINNLDYIDEKEIIPITINKHYEALEVKYDGEFSIIRILDDNNQNVRYLMNRFISLKNKRDNIISSLL